MNYYYLFDRALLSFESKNHLGYVSENQEHVYILFLLSFSHLLLGVVERLNITCDVS